MAHPEGTKDQGVYDPSQDAGFAKSSMTKRIVLCVVIQRTFHAVAQNKRSQRHDTGRRSPVQCTGEVVHVASQVGEDKMHGSLARSMHPESACVRACVKRAVHGKGDGLYSQHIMQMDFHWIKKARETST